MKCHDGLPVLQIPDEDQRTLWFEDAVEFDSCKFIVRAPVEGLVSVPTSSRYSGIEAQHTCATTKRSAHPLSIPVASKVPWFMLTRSSLTVFENMLLMPSLGSMARISLIEQFHSG